MKIYQKEINKEEIPRTPDEAVKDFMKNVHKDLNEDVRQIMQSSFEAGMISMNLIMTEVVPDISVDEMKCVMHIQLCQDQLLAITNKYKK